MKPTASFRLSKTAKRMIATEIDAHKRGEMRRAMIDAELSASIQPKREKGRRDQNSNNPAVGSV